MDLECKQCGKRTHEFLEDNVGKFIVHLRLSRPFTNKVSENEMCSRIDNGRYQILSMGVEKLIFLD
jgi:hypothetical protein